MNTTNLNLHIPAPTNLLVTINPFQIRQFRLYRRRRIKLIATRHLTVSCQLLDPFQSFLSQFPSSNSLDFLAPALGLASGLTLFLSQFKSRKFYSVSDIGEWILFTSPTPFNRFVFLRCPSISFEGSELLEDVNERLVEEDRHFVRLNSGRIQVKESGFGGLEEQLEYQRVCVSTDDGGVISLDWPANLDLTEEHGLDTTLLLVPGTAEGSMGENVRSFVCEALKHGFFPVVMNPRGCAGSPLTTARLFTAADSDDICTAIQFINKARPWTSLMGIGWGYGANMLTKYLAEVGERTPLTAAACINNPFDLEEATRCFPFRTALDQKLTGGLIDILRCNKELFQGRAKGFNVEKALMAKSVRDFEEAISMVSYGFEEIEDFYSNSSTRGVVGNVKIPVLFIQNDDGTVPLFSTPRSLIAENPFTSLLLCSCVPSSIIASGRAALSWCQNLTIEWLSSVELGLLKGRHPLLKDIDVAFNPSKGLTLVDGRAAKPVKIDKFFDLTLINANGYAIDPLKGVLDKNNAAVQSRTKRHSQGMELEEGLQEVENGALQQSSTVDAELLKEEVAGHIDTETGQVLQTAQVILNMLDVTMPGILEEGKKKKVLTALGQGETLMKALQDAVPEDVRGKLTSAVSGILHAQHANVKLDGLLDISKFPAMPSGFRSKIQEGAPNAEGTPKDPHSSAEIKKADDLIDGSDNNQPVSDKAVAEQEAELHSSENSYKSSDLGQSQTLISQQGDTFGSDSKGTHGSGNNHESEELIKEKAALSSDSDEKGLESSTKSNVTMHTEKVGGTEGTLVDEHKVDQDGGTPQLEMKRESNNQKTEEKNTSLSTDQSKTVLGNIAEGAPSVAESSIESQPMERDGNDNQKRDNKTVHPVSDQNNPSTSDSNPPSFSVAQALDALTGMDDSTQVAVNSVFGVIEDMITQLEEGNDHEEKTQDQDDIEDVKKDTTSEKEPATSEHLLKLNFKNDVGMQSEHLREPPVDEHEINGANPQNVVTTGWVEKEPAENFILYGENVTCDSQSATSSSYKYVEEIKKNEVTGGIYEADYADRHANSIPLCITANPNRDYLQNEYLQRSLLSKMPKSKPLDLDTTTALLFDYYPEDGQWKLLEQPGIVGDSIHDVAAHNGVDIKSQIHSPVDVNDSDSFIEPSYVVLDTEKQQESFGEHRRVENLHDNVENDNNRLKVMKFVKNIIFDTLTVEIDRKLSEDDMKEIKSHLASDLEQVANAVSWAIGHDNDTLCLLVENFSTDNTAEKVGTIQGECIVRAISSAVLSTSYLRSVLPVGVVVGSSLAALRKYFDVGTGHENGLTFNDQTKIYGEEYVGKSSMKEGEEDLDKSSMKEGEHKLTIRTNQTTSINSRRSTEVEEAEMKNKSNDGVMVGAVTVALGASALLVQQQDPNQDIETIEGSSKTFKENNHEKAVDKVDEAVSDKSQNNVVASLAEKAMSVAGPVVPTKEDGEVDQERLVAMLADLGQKGGLLRLVGKVALLWGGIRGAVSLTDRLISFLRMAERPLYQRIIGFFSMVLVLWSPIVVPFIPTLVQSWTTNNPSRFAELVSIVGLYTAVMILVMLWGRRIRGYEDPLEEYGLDLLKLPKIQNLFISLIGGVMLVLSIQSINALLGLVSFSWPSRLPVSSLDGMANIKACWQVIVLAGRGIITAIGVVLVEELLFRAWLPEEIANDLGYHQGIIISGLVFSLTLRSLWAVPGLWLLSLALAGFRQRSQGSLSIPIGLRAGIMASSFILQSGGFLTYKLDYPIWITGTHPFQPFSGVVGLAFCSLLAIILYPRQPLQKKNK